MLLADLQRASFKGAPFLVPSDESAEGRNTIEHLYPDASFRYAEDNGRIPPVFSQDIIVHGAGLPGKLRRVRNALSSPGPGVLKHPVYGTQFVQVDGEYTVRRNDRHAGYVEIRCTFMVTGAPVFPGLVSGVAALVTNLSSSSVTKLFKAFKAKFSKIKAPRAPTLVRVASELSEIADTLDGFFGSATSAPTQIKKSASLLVRDPDRLPDLFVESFRAPLDDRDEPLTGVEMVKRYRDTALASLAMVVEAQEIRTTTQDLAERQDMIEAIGEFCAASAFACLADAMAGRDYATENEVEADEILLTETFESIQGLGLPAEQHADMVEIYTATSEVLANAIVRLPRITTIDAMNAPLSVLCYELYEKDGLQNTLPEERIPVLGDLNPLQDPIMYAGDTTALIG